MWLELMLGVLLVGALVSAIVPLRRGRVLAQASEGWPKVRGQITESEAGESPLRTIPKVEYEYTVGGAAYHASAVTYGMPANQQAFLAALRLRPGDVVWVHYDPQNPEQAVLFPGGSALRKLRFEPIVVLNLLFSGTLTIVFVVLLVRDLLA